MNVEKDIKHLPAGYIDWRKKTENLIEKAKLNAVLHVDADMLALI